MANNRLVKEEDYSPSMGQLRLDAFKSQQAPNQPGNLVANNNQGGGGMPYVPIPGVRQSRSPSTVGKNLAADIQSSPNVFHATGKIGRGLAQSGSKVGKKAFQASVQNPIGYATYAGGELIRGGGGMESTDPQITDSQVQGITNTPQYRGLNDANSQSGPGASERAIGERAPPQQLTPGYQLKGAFMGAETNAQAREQNPQLYGENARRDPFGNSLVLADYFNNTADKMRNERLAKAERFANEKRMKELLYPIPDRTGHKVNQKIPGIDGPPERPDLPFGEFGNAAQRPDILAQYGQDQQAYNAYNQGRQNLVAQQAEQQNAGLVAQQQAAQQQFGNELKKDELKFKIESFVASQNLSEREFRDRQQKRIDDGSLTPRDIIRDSYSALQDALATEITSGKKGETFDQQGFLQQAQSAMLNSGMQHAQTGQVISKAQLEATAKAQNKDVEGFKAQLRAEGFLG